ncbi:TPA: hypothetical protein ACQVH3_005318 [Serratia marcescens]
MANSINKLIDDKIIKRGKNGLLTHAFGATAMSLRAQINELQAFAARLREGK